MFGLFRKKTPPSPNDKVREALRQHGDDGTRVRHVLHFAYPEEAGMTQDKDAARARVSGIVDVGFTEKDDSPGIVFEQHREVASAEFDDLTERLKASLAEIGWKYDGWECAVETGEQT